MSLHGLRLASSVVSIGVSILSFGVSLFGGQANESPRRPRVYVAEVDALIQPVSAEFVAQTLDMADAAEAELAVLMLRTPGGLVDSTRDINTSIIEARTPVVVFVGPSGARAASAGFLIIIAADVAVMAPGTHVGAAHPVSGGGQPMDDTAAEKAASDVAAYARSLATQRRRNVELAEKAVLESESFTEEEARAASPPLIDLVASDIEELLALLDGREVRRWDGRLEVLQTQGAEIVTLEMSWRQRLLSAVAHPQIAVLLFSLGTLGLTVELWNPGGIVPGVVGGLCLLLAFFAFQILPVNYVGLLLVFFGLVLLVLEMLTATFGVLAAGGVAAMVLGLMMLIDAQTPELQLGWGFILAVVIPLAGIVMFLVRLGVQAQRARSVTGSVGMLTQTGEVIEAIDLDGAGRVATHGEIWNATAAQSVATGTRVKVIGINGMVLTVSPEPVVERDMRGANL